MNILFFQNRKRGGVPQGGIAALYDFRAGSGQTLADQSGAGRNSTLGPTSGTDTTDPTWVSTGLSFDGVDDFVTVPNINLGGEYTLIAVSTPTNFAAARVALGTQLAPSYLGYGASSASLATVVDSIGQKAIFFTGATAGVPSMLTQRVSQVGQYFDLHFNASKSGQTATVGAHAAGTSTIATIGSGGASFFMGPIHYVALYSRLLSDAEVQTAYRNLKRTLTARGVSLP